MLWLLLTLCLVAGQPSPPQPLDAKSIFVTDHLQWQAQPGTLKHYAYRSTPGTLLLFRPDGEFDRLDCTLVREHESGPISINYRRSYRLAVGTWSRSGNGEIHVTSRLIFLTIPKVGEPIPGSPIDSHFTAQGQAVGRLAAAIEGDGTGYVPLDQVAASEVKALDQVIRMHSKEAAAAANPAAHAQP